MKRNAVAIGLITLSVFGYAQEAKTDSLNVRTIEDVKLHKAGNPNRAKVFTTKSNLDVMENPQATAIVTHEIIEQQQAQQLSDVIRNVNGMYITSARGGSQDSFGARGYIFGAENIYKNGSRVNSGIFPEVSGMERVEVLKGGAAILYGNVAPGGILNMVTKKPLFNQGGSIALSAGSWDNYKTTLDFYDALSKSSAFRVNGAFEDKGSFRDNVTSQKYYFNPSFLFNISDKTQLIVEGDYLKNYFTPDFGVGTLVLDKNTSRSVINDLIDIRKNPGSDFQYQNTQMATSTVTLNHQINTNWNLNVVGSYQNYTKDFFGNERMQWEFQPNNGSYLWNRNLTRTYNEQNYGSIQANLNGEFSTGKVKHKLLFGADADYLQSDNYTYYFQKQDGSWENSGSIGYGTNGINGTKLNPPTINLADESTWASGYEPSTAKKNLTRTPTRRVGVYIQDLISVTEKLKVLAGIRWSYLENINPIITNYEFSGPGITSVAYGKSGEKGKSSQNALSPRLGLVYQWNDTFMTFASYTNSFTPNTGTDVNLKALDASIVDQWEIGFKKNLFANTIAFNATAYQIDNSNLAQTAPFNDQGNVNTNTNIKELTGKTRSRGVELDITGNPLANLSIIAGYSYNHMTYLDTPNTLNSFIEGERIVRTPLNTANASVFYTFDKYVKGLKIGATAFYTGSRYGGWNNQKDANGNQKTDRMIPLTDFTQVDFSIAYQYKKFLLQGKLGNAFNVLNYTVHENYSVNPIMPRNVYVTLTYKL
ncbi:TonB-dependent siderophore receptor [Epilithonimonas pallida]|uniref:Iron complex outermembrane recepter protein n=1 Tax=Epilithonimonas pallida TaxID=373671 RepID=A0ABY1R2T6_9FLAO|nr:TonB-dependent siderophore receptor [Epilithonimonas pallida]SMP92058.1 iron complex outermembrane recepter protein [Epilithonimonas pallida]